MREYTKNIAAAEQDFVAKQTQAETDARHLKQLESRVKAEEAAGSDARLAAEKKQLENAKKEQAA